MAMSTRFFGALASFARPQLFHRWISFLFDPKRRAQEEQRRDFETFRDTYSALLGGRVSGGALPRPNALLVAVATRACIAYELALAKSLELAGYRPIILMRDAGWLVQYYQLIPSARVVFLPSSTECEGFRTEAADIVREYQDVEGLRCATWRGYRAGRMALSQVILERGAPVHHPYLPGVEEHLITSLAASLGYLDRIERLIDEYKPALACTSDKIESPSAEVVEVCHQKDIETIAFFDGFGSGTAVVQRVTAHNLELFSRTTMSEALWRHLSEAGGLTCCEHFQDAEAAPRAETLTELGFDVTKKTAGIYPRPFWDPSFLWGRHLASDSAHWLKETVAAAIRNDRLNWFIKLHPSYLRRLHSGDRAEPFEVRLLKSEFGVLPPHVVLAPLTETVSAQRLFDAMDICVTGSSTVAIEAASHGIPALTSDIGEHDRHGFTLDFDTFEQLLAQLGSVEKLPPLTPAQVALARQYAFGTFVLRSVPVTSVAGNSRPCTLSIRSIGEMAVRPEIRAFIDWLNHSKSEDLYIPGACPQCLERQPAASPGTL